MKYLFLSMALLTGPAFAVDPLSVNRSSYIAGGSQSGCIQANYLDKIIVGEATSGGNVMVHNSSWTRTDDAIISSVTLATIGTQDFSNTRVKGICYLADTPTNGFTILYKN